MARRWRNVLFVGFVLVASHALAAWFCAAQYRTAINPSEPQSLPLGTTQDDFAQAAKGFDAASYLRAAQNLAAGRGVTIRQNLAGATIDTPFFYWGPGTPVILGAWLRLVGGSTMWTFFWFSVAAQFLFGLIAIATAALWTDNPLALAAVGLCTGICPPMQNTWHGFGLTTSEIAALVPLSLVFYALGRAFLAWRKFGPGIDKWSWCKRVGIWFGISGVLIGLFSLVRDSGALLATFTAVFLLGRALVTDRRRLAAAAVAGGLLIAGSTAVRLPVERWNRDRIGNAVVSTSSAGCIWRYGLWIPHDSSLWISDSGIGLGEYLDPTAAKRVEQYYLDHKPLPALYSLSQLAGAILKRPLDAAAFRLSRAPVLWLDSTHPWPRIEFGLVFFWCLAFYALLAVFCLVQHCKRREIPEVLYLYVLLLICASPLVHSEFRFSLPVWNTLVLVPGLLLATLSRNGWRTQRRDEAGGQRAEPLESEPTTTPLAA